MRLGILQCKPAIGEIEHNLAKIKNLIGKKSFDLAVLPELVTTGYNFAQRKELLDLARKNQKRSLTFFADLAKAKDCAIVWGTAEVSRGKLYNAAYLTTPEGNHFVYRKAHLFYREKEIFDTGNTGFNVFSWRGVRIGIMICFDWIFPEAARTLALRGAQIIAHPSNLVMAYCQEAMVTRSRENRVFAATANRTGTETNRFLSLTFTGKSQLTDVSGRRLLTFSPREESFRSVKVAPSEADTKNINGYNHLFDDRRPQLYSR